MNKELFESCNKFNYELDDMIFVVPPKNQLLIILKII